MRRVVVGSVLSGSLIAAQALLTNEAHAGGFELSGVGTRGMGRAGANAASVDDSLALALNPALLADIDTQVTLNAHLVVWDACVQRSGTYGNPDGTGMSGDYAGGASIFGDDGNGTPSPYAGTAFPRVCNSGAPQIVPQIMANVRLTEDVGIGFGIIAPNGVGSARFGGDDGTVTANGMRLPTPTRYMVAAEDLLLFFPSIGVGYRPFDWLSVGLTLQWGVGIISFTNYVNPGSGASIPGTISEDPSSDIRARFNVTDAFVPAGILSLHFTPHDNLDIMVSGRISDSIGGVVQATGDINVTTGVYGTGSDLSYVPTQSTISGASLQAGQPFQFTLGARYADRVRPRRDVNGHRHADSLHDENWDIELNLVYEQLSQVQDFVVSSPAGSSTTLQPGGGAAPVVVPLPNPIPLPHGWSDLLTMRLGGDVNVIPDQFALRAGVSFELPVDQRYRRYASNDFIAGWRFGAHVGASLRVDSFDFSLAYGFFLGETVNNTGVANLRQVNALGSSGTCAGTPTGQPVAQSGCYPNGFGSVVNGGIFSQMFHAVSLGATYRFN